MKSFVNAIGYLALIGGVILWILEKNSAYLGAGLLPGALCLGLGRLIQLAEQEAVAAKAHRALEVNYWRLAATQSAQAHSPSAPPTTRRWFVANDEEVTGPFTKEQLLALQARGVVHDKSQLALEGTQDWQPVAAVLTP